MQIVYSLRRACALATRTTWCPPAGRTLTAATPIGQICAQVSRQQPDSPRSTGGSFARRPPALTTLCYLRCSALRLWRSSASPWCLGGQGWDGPALHELPASVLMIHDVPHRLCVRHREAPSDRPRSRPVRPACGRTSRRPASPVALPRRPATAVSECLDAPARRLAPDCHRGYAEILATAGYRH